MKPYTVVLAFFLAALGSPVQAFTLEDIERTGKQFDALEGEFFKLQERLLAQRTLQPSSANLAYDYLNSCGRVLNSVNREITSTIQVLRMSQFVWDARAQKMARPYLDVLTRALVKHLNASADYLEMIIPQSRDAQVGSICLRSRDLMRDAIPIASDLQPPWRPRE